MEITEKMPFWNAILSSSWEAGPETELYKTTLTPHYKAGAFSISMVDFAENWKGLYNPENLWRESGSFAQVSGS